ERVIDRAFPGDGEHPVEALLGAGELRVAGDTERARARAPGVEARRSGAAALRGRRGRGRVGGRGVSARDEREEERGENGSNTRHEVSYRYEFRYTAGRRSGRKVVKNVRRRSSTSVMPAWRISDFMWSRTWVSISIEGFRIAPSSTARVSGRMSRRSISRVHHLKGGAQRPRSVNQRCTAARAPWLRLSWRSTWKPRT